MAKNSHSADCRVQGFKTFHLVQRKNCDLSCSCVCCSSQRHTNAKTRLSNRAGLSSAVLTAHNILLPAGVIGQSTAVIVPIVFRQEHTSFYPKIAIISCFRTAVCTATYEK